MLILARDPTVCGRHVSGWLSTAVVGLTVVISVVLPVLYVLWP